MAVLTFVKTTFSISRLPPVGGLEVLLREMLNATTVFWKVLSIKVTEPIA